MLKWWRGVCLAGAKAPLLQTSASLSLFFSLPLPRLPLSRSFISLPPSSSSPLPLPRLPLPRSFISLPPSSSSPSLGEGVRRRAVGTHNLDRHQAARAFVVASPFFFHAGGRRQHRRWLQSKSETHNLAVRALAVPYTLPLFFPTPAGGGSEGVYTGGRVLLLITTKREKKFFFFAPGLSSHLETHTLAKRFSFSIVATTPAPPLYYYYYNVLFHVGRRHVEDRGGGPLLFLFVF